MGHRITKPPGRMKKEGTQRPSTFFIVALLVGLILLAWLFAQATARPVPANPLGELTLPPIEMVRT